MRSSIDVAALYETYRTDVWCFLERRLRGHDHALVDDMAQEVWLRAWRFRDQYEDRGKPRAWLYRIAQNLLLDWHRAPHDRHDAISFTRLTEADCEPSVTYRWDQIHERERIAHALQRLPERQRDVLRQRYWEGREYSQMAGYANANAAKKFRARALVTLRPYLEAS